MLKKSLPFFLLLFVFFFTSCKRELAIPSWKTEIAAPLISTSLNINDLLSGTDSLVQKENDSSLTIVYQQDLFSLNIDSLIEIPDSADKYTATLDTLAIGNIAVTNTLSLGQIAMGLSPLEQAVLFSFNGKKFPFAISYTGMAMTNTINFDSFFESVTLSEGTLLLKIKNGFPVSISNVSVDVKNTTSGSPIGSIFIPTIAPGATVLDSISLAGKTVEAIVEVDVTNVDLTGPALLPIDTSDVITFSITQSNLSIDSATAIFPAQSVITKEQETLLKLKGLWLNEVEVLSGNFVINVVNTLDETLYLDYQIPNSWNGSQIFSAQVICPPNGTVDSVSFPMDGYTLDLKGQHGNKTNTMFHELDGRIEYTGIQVSLSKTDSVQVYYSLQDIVPQKAIGYLKNDLYSFGPNTIDIDIFDKLSSSPINALQFDSVDLSLEISNEFGIVIDADIANFTATNTSTGASYSTSTNSTLITAPIDILPINATTSLINFSNTDAKGILETLPNQITYAANIELNPDPPVAEPVPSNSGTDFLYYGSEVSAKLNLEVPLDLIANGLILTDIVDYKMEENKTLSEIEDGSFKLIAYNGFPITSTIQIYLLDENSAVIDSLFATKEQLAAASTVSGKVSSKTRSELTIPLPSTKIDNLYLTKFMKIVIDFTTIPSSTYTKIYSDYDIDIKIIGDFSYTIDESLR